MRQSFAHSRDKAAFKPKHACCLWYLTACIFVLVVVSIDAIWDFREEVSSRYK